MRRWLAGAEELGGWDAFAEHRQRLERQRRALEIHRAGVLTAAVEADAVEHHARADIGHLQDHQWQRDAAAAKAADRVQRFCAALQNAPFQLPGQQIQQWK